MFGAVRLLVVGLILSIVPALPAAPQARERRSAAEEYGYAKTALERGEWFEDAIRRMKEAVQREPENRDYRLALGCAFASRAASVTHAAIFAEWLAKAHADYPAALANWKETRNMMVEGSDDVAGPRPVPPPRFVFRTKDDNLPFTLTRNQTLARIAELSRAARAQWEKAATLAQTPAEQAETEYVRGWGFRLLARCGEQLGKNPLIEVGAEDEEEGGDNGAKKPASTPAALGGIPAAKAITAAFRMATEKAPDNPLYWQSPGDVLEYPENVAAYRKAADLRPDDANLWYMLYRLERDAPRSGGGGQDDLSLGEAAPALPPRPPDVTKPLEYLRRAAEHDTLNAYPRYLLAALLLRKTPYGQILGNGREKREQMLEQVTAGATDDYRKDAREAVGLIEQGNRAPRYTTHRYRPAVPALLEGAWRFGRAFALDEDFMSMSALRELARATSGYGLVIAREGKIGEADRAMRAAIGVGLKLIGNWPMKDSWPDGNELITTLVGIAVTDIGYGSLETVYPQAQNPGMHRQVTAEHAAFRRRADAYRKNLSALAEQDSAEYSSYLQSY